VTAAERTIALQERRRQRALAAADERMAAAKAKFSLAALACLRNALDAPALVQRALAEIDAARSALAALEEAQP
jgi:hypothetical protein